MKECYGSIKENMIQYYNTEAELRNSATVKPEWKERAREKFVRILRQENKKTLLEIGAGPGHDSRFLMDSGLKVTAVDLSSEMVKHCRAKSVEAYELDFYDLSSLGRTFDGVYAVNTLLHVPKQDFRHVLSEIDRVLGRDGLFYLGLYGGQDTEKEWVKSEVSDTPRFFAFHSDAYLKAALADFFELLDFETLDIGAGTGVNTEVNVFYSVTMQKKSMDVNAI